MKCSKEQIDKKLTKISSKFKPNLNWSLDIFPIVKKISNWQKAKEIVNKDK